VIKVEGKCGISATIICDSISEAGVRLTTMEIQYPRIILSELNTHRMLSKNSASSRATPFAKMQEQLTGRPVRFGAAKAGMQDGGDCETLIVRETSEGDEFTLTAEDHWDCARIDAIVAAGAYHEAGYAKQVYNRLTEPFQMMKTVISGTEWDNFFFLRNDSAADPTICELARCMQEAREKSVPQLLKAGEWHLPYVDVSYVEGLQVSTISGNSGVANEYGSPSSSYIQSLSIEDAIKVSCARCAAVSYRNEGYGLEKSLQLYERLVGAEKKHASALEHCASPMQPEETRKAFINEPFEPHTWQDGVSHVDRGGQLWSGNLRGYVQHRKLIAGENYVTLASNI